MKKYEAISDINKTIRYSVIVPLFNAEKTIRRCLDSLLSEKYKAAEIIIVNDGSTDDSEKICQLFSQKNACIRYIKKENGGVSTARNEGLDIAGGEYVLFVDSDDYVVPNFFATLDAAREKEDADFRMFSCSYDNGKTKKDRILPTVSYADRCSAMPAIINAICRKTINGPVAKIYKRSIINEHQIRFPVGASVAEDRAFNICYSMFINSFSISEEVLYIVNTDNNQSLSRRRHDDLRNQFAIAKRCFEDTLAVAPIPESEKEQYRCAINFGDCRYIYHEAKLLFADQVGWIKRQIILGKHCDEINHKQMRYPHTRYCTLITLPVRLRLTWVIDAIAWKLTH